MVAVERGNQEIEKDNLMKIVYYTKVTLNVICPNETANNVFQKVDDKA